MSEPNNPMEAVAETPASVEALDGRFPADNQKKPINKALVLIAMLLVVAVVVAGGAVFYARWYLKDRAAARAEKTVKADDTTKRTGRIFDIASGLGAAPTPEGIREPQTPPPSAAIPLASQVPAPAAPIPLATGVPPSAKPPTPAPVPKPIPMMLSTPSGPAEPAPLAAVRASAPQPPAVRGSVQELARAQSLKSAVTTTNQVSASVLGNRSFLLARGSGIPCILETQLVSTVPGSTSCVVDENVYSDDGKVVLVDKGSKVQGGYGNAMRTGDKRLAVMWDRIKTPNGVVIDVASPSADGVGTAGIAGDVDNHWVERIGAAFLLSMVEDAVAYAIAGNTSAGGSSYTPTQTANTGKRMSEKVLESTINIPSTLSANRGSRIMIAVNRDMWFDTVYSLAPAPAGAQ